MGDLVKAAASLLKEGGRLCTIWPIDRLARMERVGIRIWIWNQADDHIKTMRHLPAKRVITEWVKTHDKVSTQYGELTLEGKATLDFTEAYLDIVRPYLKGT